MTYTNLRGQLADSPKGHCKYRPAVISAYPNAHYPVFKGFNHMPYRIQDPPRVRVHAARGDVPGIHKTFFQVKEGFVFNLSMIAL